MKGQWITPVVTAFDENGNIDHQANKNIYDFLIEGGMDGILIMGSTGEFFSMSIEQKKELIQLAVKYINKRVDVFVGTGGMSVDETIELSNYAYDIGADAVVIISPYYFPLSRESVELFYDKIAERTEADIYIYNFPDRTGHDITPEIALSLVRKHENIVGYKDTITEMGHTRAVIDLVCRAFPEFKVYAAFDENFVHNVLSGGAGAMGGISNFAPEICAQWVKAFNEQDFEKVSEIQKVINGMMVFYDLASPFIPITKKAMQLRGVEMKDYSLSPLIQANEEQTKKVVALMKRANLIK